MKEAEALAAEARKAMEACSPESKQTTPQNRLVFYVTHFNLFLYATCFFIQTGTLPVRQKGKTKASNWSKIRSPFSSSFIFDW